MRCPKCDARDGGDWSQCNGVCPIAVSPYYAEGWRKPQTFKIRTFTLMAEISGPLEGDINDWPQHIKERIWEALEAKSQEVELPLALLQTYCDSDFHGHWYAYGIASEIVAGEKHVKAGYLER